MTICPHCKGLFQDTAWDTGLREKPFYDDNSVTHDICAKCAAKMKAKADKENIKKSQC